MFAMQDEISALKAENARKDAENAEMKAQIKNAYGTYGDGIKLNINS